MRKKNKATILIVDDKPANLMALENLLESDDRILLTANNGKDALKTTLNKDIDLIILDVQMPDMDGFEVAQILKSNKRTKDIPIIFASAERKEHKFMMKGYEEGAIDYLFKPLDPELAKAKVAVLLQVQLQKKELIEKNLSLEKSALLINNSADIIGIIDVTTFKIEEINQAFTTILGYSIAEAKETSLVFFLGNEDRIIVQKLSKKPQERLSFETRIYCKDRSIKWLQWNVVVKYGKWFVNARDITEIKQVERIRNYLATVVKQSNDAIYIHDEEGKIISWNEGAEEIYGYKEKEAVKMNMWNIIPEFNRIQTEELIDKVFSGKKIQDIETKRITKHGKLIDVLFSASVITEVGSVKKSVAVTERDITLQKITDERIKQLNVDLQTNVSQLEMVNKELESFSYSVSHDLRAPLRAIDGYAGILEEDYGKNLDEEGNRLLEAVQYNAKKMGTLIDDLLAFSRLGKKELTKTDINMNELVEGALYELNKSIKHKAEVKIAPLHPAKGDYGLINQVVINLLSNAIKYSAKVEKPLVVVSSEEMPTEVIYTIKDNGAGFDMRYANKLFGVFQRLHTADEFEGTGVGLAIVQRIMVKHGGKVWAEGEVDKGATFKFLLPIN
jgi:PAS domain S-box-containing protein